MLRRFPQLFWGLVALAAAVLGAGVATAIALRSIRRTGDEIAVTGSAKRPVRADFAIWRVQVGTQAPTPQQGVAQVAAGTTRVTAFLRERGIPEGAVTVRPLESFAIPETGEGGRETGRVAAWRVSQFVEVRSADVDRITRLAGEASALVADGVPVSPQPPEYLYTKLSEIRAGLLAEATKDARTRAVAIAGSTGNTVGPVRSARMGVFQITPRNSTEVSDYGINDVSAVEKDVTAVVRVAFAVE